MYRYTIMNFGESRPPAGKDLMKPCPGVVSWFVRYRRQVPSLTRKYGTYLRSTMPFKKRKKRTSPWMVRTPSFWVFRRSMRIIQWLVPPQIGTDARLPLLERDQESTRVFFRLHTDYSRTIDCEEHHLGIAVRKAGPYHNIAERYD